MDKIFRVYEIGWDFICIFLDGGAKPVIALQCCMIWGKTWHWSTNALMRLSQQTSPSLIMIRQQFGSSTNFWAWNAWFSCVVQFGVNLVRQASSTSNSGGWTRVAAGDAAAHEAISRITAAKCWSIGAMDHGGIWSERDFTWEVLIYVGIQVVS